MEKAELIVLAPLQLVDGLGRPLHVSAEGEVTLPNGHWGRVASDGTVRHPDGRLRARLAADGRVFDANDHPFAVIAEDGAAKLDAGGLRFDEDGTLVGGPSEIKLVPADSPAKRAAMLVVLTAVMRPVPSDLDLTPDVQFRLQ